MNLILIGLRGSGKTTVGRIVADALGHDFWDLDELTASLLGKGSVADAWRAHGEEAFRQKEAQGLYRMLGEGLSREVIATGGGAPTAPGVAKLLKQECAAGRAKVIYLSAKAQTLRQRLEKTDLSARPSLTGASPLDEIDEVLARRDPLYRALASVVIYTDGKTEQEVANEVLTEVPRG